MKTMLACLVLAAAFSGCASSGPKIAKSRIPASYYISARCVDGEEGSGEKPRPDLDALVLERLDQKLGSWAGTRLSASALPAELAQYRLEKRPNPDRRGPYFDIPSRFIPATETGPRLFVWVGGLVFSDEVKAAKEKGKIAAEIALSVLTQHSTSLADGYGHCHLYWALASPGGELVDSGELKSSDIDVRYIRNDLIASGVAQMMKAAGYKAPLRKRVEE